MCVKRPYNPSPRRTRMTISPTAVTPMCHARCDRVGGENHFTNRCHIFAAYLKWDALWARPHHHHHHHATSKIGYESFSSQAPVAMRFALCYLRVQVTLP